MCICAAGYSGSTCAMADPVCLLNISVMVQNKSTNLLEVVNSLGMVRTSLPIHSMLILPCSNFGLTDAVDSSMIGDYAQLICNKSGSIVGAATSCTQSTVLQDTNVTMATLHRAASTHRSSSVESLRTRAGVKIAMALILVALVLCCLATLHETSRCGMTARSNNQKGPYHCAVSTRVLG